MASIEPAEAARDPWMGIWFSPPQHAMLGLQCSMASIVWLRALNCGIIYYGLEVGNPVLLVPRSSSEAQYIASSAHGESAATPACCRSDIVGAEGKSLL